MSSPVWDGAAPSWHLVTGWPVGSAPVGRRELAGAHGGRAGGMWDPGRPTFTLCLPQPPSAKYGGRHTVTMIPGDGIGPELMLHVKSVFRYGAPGSPLCPQAGGPEDFVPRGALRPEALGEAMAGLPVSPGLALHGL